MTQAIHTIYFPAAVALGALHALEPGHAKALTASYLIGIKGTKRDSLVLGLSVAATHSLVVILISAMGIWIGNEAFTGRATEWLETASGLIAVAIGCWMLWRRLFLRKNSADDHHHHPHSPDPVLIHGSNLQGQIDIIDTPLGERMRFSSDLKLPADELLVKIERVGGTETLALMKSRENHLIYLSAVAPDEPHEFSATLNLGGFDQPEEQAPFSITEPEHHHHDHSHLDDEAHARAHAATLPEYARKGERPTLTQIIAFGAAGGMIPCPASVTVMLLSVSTGKTGLGVFTVLGFSLGLALALVGVGVIIVTGLSKLSETGKLSWITKRAPVVSAALVIVSGLFALLFAHQP